jgi:hypothetical protein
MELAGYVVNAVVLEGRSVREVAQAHGVSKSWCPRAGCTSWWPATGRGVNEGYSPVLNAPARRPGG